MRLRQIVQNVFPDSINNTKLFNDTMDVLCEIIEDKSNLSLNVTNIYDNDNKEIKEALYKIYLQVIYKAIENFQKDPVKMNGLLQDRYIDSNYILIKKEITEILNSDFFNLIKKFSQEKGTLKSINYAYNLAQYLETHLILNDFELIEKRPFYFEVIGSINNSLFMDIVYPLAIPLGFTFNYMRTITHNFIDEFNLVKNFEFEYSEVRCFENFKYFVFIEEYDDTKIREVFKQRINPKNGYHFRDKEFDEQVTVMYGYKSLSIEEPTDENPIRETKYIHMENLNVDVDHPERFLTIVYKLNDHELKLIKTSQIFERKFDEHIINWESNNCALFASYRIFWEITTKDEFLTEIDFYVHKVDDSTGGFNDTITLSDGEIIDSNDYYIISSDESDSEDDFSMDYEFASLYFLSSNDKHYIATNDNHYLVIGKFSNNYSIDYICSNDDYHLCSKDIKYIITSFCQFDSTIELSNNTNKLTDEENEFVLKQNYNRLKHNSLIQGYND